MSTISWGTHGVVTTEQSTTLLHEYQQSFDIWTVTTSDSGYIAPKLLGRQLGTSFVEAIKNWLALSESEEYYDPLSRTFNGLPLVETRQEALALASQYQRRQV